MINSDFWAQPLTLPRAAWHQPRRARTRYITIHYNGPAVPGAGKPNAERAQLQFDAAYHMRPNVLNADGIQYHIAILSDGQRVKLRDLDDRLWHCGNALGNAESIAIHIPIGDAQPIAPAQAQSLRETLDALRAEYTIFATNIRRHNEWKATACPGKPLTAFVDVYRSVLMAGTPFQWFVCTTNANVRLAPDVNSRVLYTMPERTIFAVSRIVENGVPFGGNPAYVACADGVGYVHLSIVRAV